MKRIILFQRIVFAFSLIALLNSGCGPKINDSVEEPLEVINTQTALSVPSATSTPTSLPLPKPETKVPQVILTDGSTKQVDSVCLMTLLPQVGEPSYQPVAEAVTKTLERANIRVMETDQPCDAELFINMSFTPKGDYYTSGNETCYVDTGVVMIGVISLTVNGYSPMGIDLYQSQPLPEKITTCEYSTPYNMVWKGPLIDALSEFWGMQILAYAQGVEEFQGVAVNRLRNLSLRDRYSISSQEINEIIPILLLTLSDGDPASRADSAKILGDIGPESYSAIPFILQNLESEENEYNRNAYFEALREISGIDLGTELDQWEELWNAVELETPVSFDAVLSSTGTRTYREDFALNMNNWEIGKDIDDFGEITREFRDGKYRVSMTSLMDYYASITTIPVISAKDFILTFDVTVIESTFTPGNMHLMLNFREVDGLSGRHYCLNLLDDGSAYLDLWPTENWQDIVTLWSHDPNRLFAFSNGVTNTISIEVNGSTITVFVNGEKVDSVTDTIINDQGTISIGLLLYKTNEKVGIEFDNLIIQEIQ
jgi:hypothetical protein